jgi:membrane protein implicated in regulation of membrane protease activity
VPYLVGSVLLINEMGAAGAAVAWSLRALVNAALLARIARRVSGFDFSPWPANEREYFIALVILLLPPLVAGLTTPSTLVRLGVTCAALALHGAMIWTRVLTNEERTAMQRMLSPGRWRGRGSAAA